MRFRALMCSLAGLACSVLLASSAMAQGGELVRAEWGISGNRVDVTARVRTFVHDGVLQLQVTRFNLGIDPAPHQVKDLIVRVRRWNGEVEEFKYPERSTVALELDPDDRWDRHDDHEREERREEAYEHHERGLRILRAYYGADGQFANVTEALRGRVDDGHLFVHIDNYTMGVDPVPGVHKWLRVLYVYDGERRNLVADEKTDLRLP